MKIPYCTGCGEYPGDFVADEIEALHARIAYLEGCAEVNAKMIAKTADDVVRYKRQAEKAEAALTEARARLATADRMAYWLDKLHECGSGQVAEVSQLLYEWESGQ